MAPALGAARPLTVSARGRGRDADHRGAQEPLPDPVSALELDRHGVRGDVARRDLRDGLVDAWIERLATGRKGLHLIALELGLEEPQDEAHALQYGRGVLGRDSRAFRCAGPGGRALPERSYGPLQVIDHVQHVAQNRLARLVFGV